MIETVLAVLNCFFASVFSVACWREWLRYKKRSTVLEWALGSGLLLLLVLSVVAPAARGVYKADSYGVYIFAASCLLGVSILLARSFMPPRIDRNDVIGRFLSSDKSLWVCVLVSMSIAALGLEAGWDQSGWTDSRAYDNVAHGIATGENWAGSSYYMPLYQYGLGLLYYLFGHFFFVPQLVNIVCAGLIVVFFAMGCRRLFENRHVESIVVLWAALAPQLHYGVIQTQIETWYIPLVSLAFWAWASYWRQRTVKAAVLLALALGLVINTRTQGAFLIGCLMLTPFFIPNGPWKKRGGHFLLICLLFAISLLPWSVRNYLVEGRFSPSSDQAAIQLAIMNDKRIAFYGIRYDINYNALLRELRDEFPERQAMIAEANRRFRDSYFEDLGWLANAVKWRSVAYFGLLPPGIFAHGGAQPTDWSVGRLAIYTYSSLAGLLAIWALFGLFIRPSLPAFQLAAALVGNWFVVFFAGFGDPRILYPVLPVHVALGMCMLREPLRGGYTPSRWGGSVSIKKVAVLVAFMLVAGVGARCYVGEPNAYRKMMVEETVIDPDVTVDRSGVALEGQWAKPVGWHGEALTRGQKVYGFMEVTNNMFPPKYAHDLQDPSIPDYAKARQGAVFFMGHGSDGGGLLGVTYGGATFQKVPREGDCVEFSGTVLDMINARGWRYLWLRAEAVRQAENKGICQ